MSTVTSLDLPWSAPASPRYRDACESRTAPGSGWPYPDMATGRRYGRGVRRLVSGGTRRSWLADLGGRWPGSCAARGHEYRGGLRVRAGRERRRVIARVAAGRRCTAVRRRPLTPVLAGRIVGSTSLATSAWS